MRGSGVALALVALLALAPDAPARGLSYTWTGGGDDANWSNPANWGGTAPANGESSVSLTFPELSGPYESHNDRTGLVVTFLQVTTQVGSGTYAFSGNAISLAGPVTLGSPGSGTPNLVWQIPLTLLGNVTIGASGRQTQLAGDIDLGARTLTLNTGGDIVVSGLVSGTGNLVKNNTSALTLSHANSYSGTTTSNIGALYLSDAAGLGTADGGTTIAGGFLGFAPGSAFTLGEPLTFTGGGITAYGTPTIAGPLTLNAAVNVNAFEPATVLTVSSPAAGSGGITKKGPGRLVLSGANTYAGGTTIAAGTAQLDGSLAATADLRVQSGGTLNGRGATAGAIVVDGGGTLAPGASPGRLTCGGLTLAAGATLAAEIAGAAAGSEYDQLAVNGPVRLDGTLAVAFSATPVNGQLFTLIDQSGAAAVAGTFAGRPEGATFQVDGTLFGITYAGGSGNDVVLITAPGSATATPTPTATTSVAATPTATPTSPPTFTPTIAATATPTATPTFTATPTVAACARDCNGSDAVEINELVLGVTIALGTTDVSACPAFDTDGNGSVAIQELIAAVNNALGSCR
ncbi:MAG: autotransporter-associated beta strand repeat-containing protein [Candidatus Binatia bacterium]